MAIERWLKKPPVDDLETVVWDGTPETGAAIVAWLATSLDNRLRFLFQGNRAKVFHSVRGQWVRVRVGDRVAVADGNSLVIRAEVDLTATYNPVPDPTPAPAPAG